MASNDEQIALFKRGTLVRSSGEAIVAGALICSGCRGILKTSNDFSEEEWKAYREETTLPPQTCNTVKVECKRFDGQR